MNIIINNGPKADIFASLFQHIKLFSEHVNIMFEKERMYLQSMDTSRVSIFEIELSIDWFDVYEHTQASNICLGINTNILYKILNSRDKGQKMNIVYNSTDTDRLFVHFTCENKEIFDKHFELPLMDIECDIIGIPEIDSQADLTINSSNFANIINQLQMFGDDLNIECSEEKISLCATSQETGKMTVDINIDDLDEFAINDGETISLSFGLKYLHNICMYSKLAKDIEIKLTRDYPMKITYSLGNENSKMIFYLAPKINDNDD
jgi:proliferating cell nuclear antigen